MASRSFSFPLAFGFGESAVTSSLSWCISHPQYFFLSLSTFVSSCFQVSVSTNSLVFGTKLLVLFLYVVTYMWNGPVNSAIHTRNIQNMILSTLALSVCRHFHSVYTNFKQAPILDCKMSYLISVHHRIGIVSYSFFITFVELHKQNSPAGLCIALVSLSNITCFRLPSTWCSLWGESYVGTSNKAPAVFRQQRNRPTPRALAWPTQLRSTGPASPFVLDLKDQPFRAWQCIYVGVLSHTDTDNPTRISV
jgi:hypothetical protein